MCGISEDGYGSLSVTNLNDEDTDRSDLSKKSELCNEACDASVAFVS